MSAAHTITLPAATVTSTTGTVALAEQTIEINTTKRYAVVIQGAEYTEVALRTDSIKQARSIAKIRLADAKPGRRVATVVDLAS